MSTIFNTLEAIGIVPVIKLNDAADALPLARALCAGGLPCAEITFRTAAAEESIRMIAGSLPDMLVGAGTVTTTEQVDRAVDAGAQFIVSPGLNPGIVRHCQQTGVPIIPGTATASDMEAALALGLSVVKFFPAELNGGIKALRTFAAVYGNLRFMPTGGITANNLNDYLGFEKVIASGGSWMVDPALIAAGDFEGITALTREAVHAMLGFELSHIGINSQNEAEAEATGRAFADMLGLPLRDGGNSIFAGSIIEVMKGTAYGTHGHIAIGTHDLLRAKAYLERQGCRFDAAGTKPDADDTPVLPFIGQEFGGFAVHLQQKN